MNNLYKPLVSVLMPAYNAERFIREAINCILNQSYQNVELLIADDASTDKTKDIINSYKDKRIRKFNNTTNCGYLKTWNKLIAEAKGDFITFQDADDLSDLRRIELLLKAFEENPDVAVCGSNYKRITEQGEIVYVSDFAFKHEEIIAKMPHKFDLVGSAIIIKREVYEEIGGYHEFFDRMGAEDYYWLYRITEKFKILNITQPLYYYRNNVNSIAGNLSDNIMKQFSFRTVGFLVEQRRKTGTDDLETGDHTQLNEFLIPLKKPYIDDPSLFYREMAAKYYYEDMKQRSIRLMLKALIKNPYKKQNYNDMFYLVKKSILGFLKKVLLSPLNMYFKIFPDAWRVANWKKQGCPAPPPHIIKYKNILKYKKKHNPKVFVETGTYMGDMDYKLRRHFKAIYTIELDEKLYDLAKKRLCPHKNINMFHGDSGEVLPKILGDINENALFWLDGHYSMGNTAKGNKITPIVKELHAISSHMLKKNLKHIIMIDDARLFNGTDDYPEFNKMEELINQIFPNYNYEVGFDAIIIYPNLQK